ncbi:transglycosylase domain-containing protein [Ramlibacter monticola]|uniref:Transglycosylase domain-containing protein n=1 Tax=Ramlibacter monticola TaxID=1926872 RepID=A0A936Z5S6_9BURK|nr:transglycosylase domain-containing protein [Ramlibacter monticola]MBL0393821.1 transglycosylase domain-containing protein [Ramlibacter monticola]
MKRATEGVTGRAASGLRRIAGAIRRHPWRAALALPLALVVYTAALLPFTPSIGDIKKAKQEQPSVVLSADGKELAVFKRANRDWVKLADISPKVTDALLATEDKRFYEHHGIDVARTAKAVLNTLNGDVEGGSTLTQQLARNLYPGQIGREQTVTRKVKEAITALKIEAVYSKEEILETYLNSVSFLYNAWGIQMAARTYFDKSAKDLNEVEAATLVGMLKGTAYYNPVMNPERALQRRNTVLAMMVKEGKLPEARYEQLKAQPMKLDFERVPEFNGMAPHLAESLRRWLIEWADRHDYNIYADGLVVRTTIDSRLQEMATKAVERQTRALQAVADVEWSRSALVALGSDPNNYAAARGKYAPFEFFWNSNPNLVKAWIKDSQEYKAAREQGQGEAQALKDLQANAEFMRALRRQKTLLQAGFLAIEPQTGAVKAWVGSRDYAEDKFDHVQQARRQAGSTFKPFVYGAAFEMGHQPNETLMDQPVEIQIDRNKVWRPGDIEGSPTGLPVTLRDGLAKSKNTITAQLMMQVGPSRVAGLARAMGVRQSKLDEVPSLALGTSPVTLKEMVASFGTIANGGNYIEPQIVTAVEDRQHNVLESFAPRTPEPALQNQAALTLLDVLRGTIEYGTAAGLRPRFGLSGDLAGKTGTTQDNTDGWFILMHPQLVAGAWVGFNDNRVTMRSSYWGQGAHNALLLVGDFMQQTTKANLVDAKAAFAAPRLRDQEKPLLDRMGDWWNSVFNIPTEPASEPEVASLPPVNLEPPVLEPPPQQITVAPPPLPLPETAPLPAVTPDAPVIADNLPRRIPAFPRPLEQPAPARPIDTIPGTQVYRMPDTPRNAPDPTLPPDVVRAPPQTARTAPPAGTGSSTATLGGPSSRADDRIGGPATSREPATNLDGRSDGTAMRGGTAGSNRPDTTTTSTPSGSSRPDTTATTGGGSRPDTLGTSPGSSTRIESNGPVPSGADASPSPAPAGQASGSVSAPSE